MANLYMALADQTRLRLLSHMYHGEVCVGDFTDALGDSQPKISRHLAYLRNAGIAKTRREGKWIHYSIRWPEDPAGRSTLQAALEWLAKSPHSTRENSEQAQNAGTDRRSDDYSRDIYANAYVANEEPESESGSSAHNELEEFLL